ncbi:MAG: immunoglobulin domain-containing protein [Verrucomicrobiae bacterium]|nr:immunoglobulin domain-containing protein [Verrucomicrobiae bacterium]
MKNTVQRHAILLAALLQVLPIVRNFFVNPAATSSFAFILKWGMGTAAVVGAYDAASGATNGFAGGTNVTITINTPYTTNAILFTKTSGDGGALCTITNSSSTNILMNGQSTTNGMPAGISFKFIDVNSGSSSFSNVYCQISGTPTQVVTNTFHVYLFYQSGVTPVESFFRIAVVAAASSAPVITSQPVAGATNLVGTTNNSFSVTAGGTAPLNYQWYFNTNTAVSGATNSSLTLTNIQLTNSGYYRCTITNSAGATNSANALLTVWQPPVITNQPANFTNVAGGGASFTVLAGGVPTLNYQWKYNITTAISGATGSTYNLANLRASQTGSYSVVITNSAGAITSSPATLIVTNPLVPPVSSGGTAGGRFNFTFTPVIGLTNTVLTNGNLIGGNWGVWTNLPPPANNNPITLSNTFNLPNLFYRLMVMP